MKRKMSAGFRAEASSSRSPSDPVRAVAHECRLCAAVAGSQLKYRVDGISTSTRSVFKGGKVSRNNQCSHSSLFQA